MLPSSLAMNDLGSLTLLQLLVASSCTYLEVHNIFSIVSQSSYYTIFICAFSASSAFVVVWVDRHGQYV